MNVQDSQTPQTGEPNTEQTSSQVPGTDQSTTTTQTSEQTDVTLEQAKDQIAKMKAEYEHMLTVHQEMKTKYDRKVKAEEEAARKALEEQGKFRELYEGIHHEHETLKALAEKQTAVIAALRDAELQHIPEKFKAIIPQGDPVNQLEWIAQARKAGVFEVTRQSGDGTPPPATKPNPGIMSIYKE
jgi:muconolactone delta-isomerase